MDEDSLQSAQHRIKQLERQLRFTWSAGLALLALLAVGMQVDSSQPDSESETLRTQQLIVEDEEGRPRIILGAPIVKVDGRVRQDSMTGLLVLDENGIDRVAVGSPVTDPQVEGEIHSRNSPATGISFNDKNGNERGGLGILDGDNRVVLGLDRKGGEGVVLFILPNGRAGLLINGTDNEPGGGGPQRVFLGTSPSSHMPELIMYDTSETARLLLQVGSNGSPKLTMLDENEEPIVTIPEQHNNDEQ